VVIASTAIAHAQLLWDQSPRQRIQSKTWETSARTGSSTRGPIIKAIAKGFSVPLQGADPAETERIVMTPQAQIKRERLGRCLHAGAWKQ